jgi:hypothetical protein
MNYQIAIKENTVNEVEGYWTTDDLIKLCERFNFPDAATAEVKIYRNYKWFRLRAA